MRSFYEVARDFEPDVVVSDFESFVLTVARRERVPAISVDNIMMLDRCRHDEGIIGGDTLDFELARQIARTKAAGLHWAIVPTFFRPPLRRKATTLVAPVLREAVLAARAEQGEHLLVYQTAAGSETLVRALHETGPALPALRRAPRPRPRTSSTASSSTGRSARPVFLDDLRTARGVIAGGGFSLLSECVYLHKPALSIPVAGQFEQTLNARYLERLGYGEYAEAPSPEAHRAPSSSACPTTSARSRGYAQDGNHEALAALREQLALVALERAGRRRVARGAPRGRPAPEPARARRTRPGRPRDPRRRRTAALRLRPRAWRSSRSRSRAPTAGPRSCRRRTGSAARSPASSASSSAASRSPATTC